MFPEVIGHVVITGIVAVIAYFLGVRNAKADSRRAAEQEEEKPNPGWGRCL